MMYQKKVLLMNYGLKIVQIVYHTKQVKISVSVTADKYNCISIIYVCMYVSIKEPVCELGSNPNDFYDWSVFISSRFDLLTVPKKKNQFTWWIKQFQ